MRPAKRTNQGGSVLVYTVVAIVLGLLVVGAVYTVNKLGHTDGEMSEVAVNTEENDATDESTNTSDEKETDNKPDQSSETTKSEDDNAKKSENNSDKSTVGQTDSKDSDSSSQRKSDDSSKKLTNCQTGPADVIYSLVALSAIGFATASYVQSRRSLI